MGDVEYLPEGIKAKLKELDVRNEGALALLPIHMLREFGLSDEDARDVLIRAGASVEALGRGFSIGEKLSASWRLPTGSPSLDRLLEGGVRRGQLTDFFGRAGMGKTQICFQLCVMDHIRRKGGIALFIDCAGTFRPERVAEICTYRGLNPEDVLRDIFALRAINSAEQLAVVDRAERVAKEQGCTLVVIDSITENFLFEYRGVEALVRRQSMLVKHLHSLARLAMKYNLAVVATNLVRMRFDGERSYEVEVGSMPMSLVCATRVHLMKPQEQRLARRVQPPRAGAETFAIDQRGVR